MRILLRMMLALTLLHVVDAFDDVAYADADDVNTDANMPNDACHLANVDVDADTNGVDVDDHNCEGVELMFTLLLLMS